MKRQGENGPRMGAGRAVICILAIFMMTVGPVQAEINVWQILVDPPGEIVGNQTRVTVTAYMDIYSENKYTFSPDNTLRMRTELEDAVWSPALLYDGVLTDLPVRSGRSIMLSAWDLSYPSGKKEALRVTVRGWAPGVGSDEEKMLLWLAEESPHGIVSRTEKKKTATIHYRPGAVREELPVVPVGTLHVVSDPPGAEVILAGESRGRTPLTLEHVPAGEQLLTLSLPGYHETVMNVSIIPRETVRVSARLVRGTATTAGTLEVESRPAGATVFLDGEERGTTPLTIGSVEPGKHLLRLEMPGYRQYEKVVPVNAGGIAAHSISLLPDGSPSPLSAGLPEGDQDTKPGSLTVTSSPSGAMVTLDGKSRGITPLIISSLPPGPHTLAITLPFFAEHADHLSLSPGEEKAVHYSFGLHDIRIPGLDTITGFFRGVPIGFPPAPPGAGESREKPNVDRGKAYEELLKQMEEEEG